MSGGITDGGYWIDGKFYKSSAPTPDWAREEAREALEAVLPWFHAAAHRVGHWKDCQELGCLQSNKALAALTAVEGK